MVLAREDACRQFELPVDRTGDVVICADRGTVLGTAPADHDLSVLRAPLRSHGGLAEREVPMLSNQPLPEDGSGRRLRNYDAFWVGLNGAIRGVLGRGFAGRLCEEGDDDAGGDGVGGDAGGARGVSAADVEGEAGGAGADQGAERHARVEHADDAADIASAEIVHDQGGKDRDEAAVEHAVGKRKRREPQKSVELAQMARASAMPANMITRARWRPIRSARPPRNNRPAVLPPPIRPSSRTAADCAMP